MKRHKWSKKLDVQITERSVGRIKKELKVYNVKECEICGLRRGTTLYSITVYFDENNIVLSTNKLPYGCMDIKAKEWYFLEEDFIVR